MTKLSGIVFITGVLLCMGAAMMAIDFYMTDDRKTAIRADINDQLDESAAHYAERREEGCRRRCGFLGSMATVVTSFRDGIFAGPPFDPEAVFPKAPDGWQMQPYDLAAVEAIVGHKLQRTQLVSPTYNQLLTHFDDAAKAAETGAVRLYTNGRIHLAVAIRISEEGMRGDGHSTDRPTGNEMTSTVTVDGVPFLIHPQVSVDALRDTRITVDYRHFSMNLDGQVLIDVLTRATLADIEAVLSRFDLEPMIENLPRKPTGYRPDGRSLSLAQTDQVKG